VGLGCPDAAVPTPALPAWWRKRLVTLARRLRPPPADGTMVRQFNRQALKPASRCTRWPGIPLGSASTTSPLEWMAPSASSTRHSRPERFDGTPHQGVCARVGRSSRPCCWALPGPERQDLRRNWARRRSVPIQRGYPVLVRRHPRYGSLATAASRSLAACDRHRWTPVTVMAYRNLPRGCGPSPWWLECSTRMGPASRSCSARRRRRTVSVVRHVRRDSCNNLYKEMAKIEKVLGNVPASGVSHCTL